MPQTVRTRPDWPGTMRPSTAAEYLDMSRNSFERLVRAGRIKFVLPGDIKERFYKRSDLDAFIQASASQTYSA